MHRLEIAGNGIRLDQMNSVEEAFHVGAEAAFVGEAVDGHLAVEQAAGSGVLQAELAVESGLRTRPVGIGHDRRGQGHGFDGRSEEHTSELQSLMRISYAVFCLKKKKQIIIY